MRARQFAICDSDENYLKMLQAYLQKKKLADFEILTFDTIRGACLLYTSDADVDANWV